MPARELDPAAIERLRRYRWPGNVRELENCIHRAVLLSRGEIVGSEAIMLSNTDEATVASPSDRDGAASALVGNSVADVERRLIVDTLAHTLGNRTRAATILGISIRTLRNKLKQYSEEGVAIPPPGPGSVDMMTNLP